MAMLQQLLQGEPALRASTVHAGHEGEAPLALHKFCRLLGLLCAASWGIDPDDMQSIEAWLKEAHGYRATMLVKNMMACHLLRTDQDPVHFRRSLWVKLNEAFQISNDDPDFHVEDLSIADIYKCVEAPYGKIAPLSARLVELASTDRFPLFHSSISMLRGPTHTGANLQAGKHRGRDPYSDGLNTEAKFRKNKRFFNSTPDTRAGHTLVVFLGGCTRAEIASIRALGQRHGKRYVILTTGIVTGSTMVSSFDMGWRGPQPVGRESTQRTFSTLGTGRTNPTNNDSRTNYE